MRISARLRLRYPSRAGADRVDRATRVDHGGFLTSRVRGERIEVEATADSPMSLLHTLEDYLSCVAVAERLSRR